MSLSYDFSQDPVYNLLEHTAVIPILTISHIEEAVPVAQAFAEGGLHVIEVTLRTPAALEVIKTIKSVTPNIIVGAGTVLHPEQFAEVEAAGADFAISPGLTEDLAIAAKKSSLPFLPGVATASEVINAKNHGFHIQKFFPAESAGGVKMLKAWQPVFPDVKFVPTGQITTANMDQYFDAKNVLAVGGSWIATKTLIENHDWGVIAELAEQVSHHQRRRGKREANV